MRSTDCSNKMHPNFHLNTHLAGYPIEDISGFNETVFKKAVSLQYIFCFGLYYRIEIYFLS